MRRLTVFAAAALLSCARVEPAARPVSATPPLGLRTVQWCDRTYPWDERSFKTVKLGPDCTASYQEAALSPPNDFAAWTWRIVDPVRYEDDGKVAIVTLEMRQTMTGRPDETFRRIYWFRWDGRAPALVRADPVVP